MRQDSSIERIRSLFDYDPLTGDLIRIASVGGGTRVGDRAACLNTDGYVVVNIDKRQYRAHRIAWLLTYGAWPRSEIDHINGVKSDNRISNLRLASPSQNQANRKKKQNKAGHRGIHWNARDKRWNAKITVDGKQIHLGMFTTPDAAAEAYRTAAEKYFGEYASPY